MKAINQKINEAVKVIYDVAFIGCYDEEDLPISASIHIDHKDMKAFEKFLEDEQDNIFAHAEGGNVEY